MAFACPQGQITQLPKSVLMSCSQHFVGLLHLETPAGHFEHTQRGPRSARNRTLTNAIGILSGPNGPSAEGRLPCTFMHALHTCATYPFFVLRPMGKTPYVMVKHAMS